MYYHQITRISEREGKIQRKKKKEECLKKDTLLLYGSRFFRAVIFSESDIK